MKYSLLVPCYNAAQYIDGFIAHLSLLTKPFDEVIFYDDASTDQTAAIITAYGFRLIQGKVNKGPGFARNQLAAAASGDYFHFHDVDDEMMPAYLDKTAQIAESGLYDVILCNVDWYAPAKTKVLLSWQYSHTEINKNALCYTIASPVGGINGLYKKEKFIAAGGFNTEVLIWEDADMHVKLAAAKAQFYVIEEVLCIAIRYHDSVSANQARGWTIRLGFLQSYYQRFTDSVTRKVIGKQAQLTASNLIMTSQFEAAKTALQLSEKCKVKVPENENPVWSILKAVTPPWFRINLRIVQLKIAFRKTIND